MFKNSFCFFFFRFGVKLKNEEFNEVVCKLKWSLVDFKR